MKFIGRDGSDYKILREDHCYRLYPPQSHEWIEFGLDHIHLLRYWISLHKNKKTQDEISIRDLNQNEVLVSFDGGLSISMMRISYDGYRYNPIQMSDSCCDKLESLIDQTLK